MKRHTRGIAVLMALALGLCTLPLAAEEAATGNEASTGTTAAAGTEASASEEDIFGQEESVATTTEQTQNASPRDELLKSTVPWITGTFSGSVGVSGTWNDVWGSDVDLLAPDSHGLTDSGTDLTLGFVARPATDISVTGVVKTSYPFTQDITAVTDADTGATTTTTVPDFTVWSLYSKFNLNDTLFFTFGKQPVKWGTGYFFSPADDIFAQSEVDLDNPTAEREGPMALKIQYPIPRTMDNLYLFAVMPSSSGSDQLLAENIAVAAKAEFLFGNTEAAVAGYYQRQQRPQLILMATTGTGNLNFFGEGLAAFADPEEEAYVEKKEASWNGGVSTSDYTVTDASGDMIYCATAGALYSNSDWNFTAVGQYLYNGYGYDDVTLGDLLQALTDRAAGHPAGEPTLSYATLYSSLSGLGKIGRHYGVLSLGWSDLWNTDVGFTLLALANLSDGSGYVKPTLSWSPFTYVTISGSASFTWGGSGDEFTDESDLLAAFTSGKLADYVAKPTMTLLLDVSIGSTSF